MGKLMVLFIVIGFSCAFEIQGHPDELTLFRHITGTVDPHVRPVSEWSDAVHLKLGLSLVSILDVDESKSILTTQTYIKMFWIDQLIAWDPNEFGNITLLNIPINRIWQPDIVLSNMGDKATTNRETLATVSYDGAISLVSQQILKSQCPFDLTSFPYDTQECHLKFASSTYSFHQLDLQLLDNHTSVDLSSYIPSNKWLHLQSTAQMNVKSLPCCPGFKFKDLTFTLKFSRMHHLECIVYIMPMVVTGLLCPFIFLLPYSQSQRFTLGGCLLIYLVVHTSSMKHIFLSASPGTAIARYYVGITCLLVLSLVVSTVSINIAARATGSSSLPNKITKKIFLEFLGRFLCVSSATELHYGSSEKKLFHSEWRTLAKVLDRLFFVLYVVLIMALSFRFLT